MILRSCLSSTQFILVCTPEGSVSYPLDDIVLVKTVQLHWIEADDKRWFYRHSEQCLSSLYAIFDRLFPQIECSAKKFVGYCGHDEIIPG